MLSVIGAIGYLGILFAPLSDRCRVDLHRGVGGDAFPFAMTMFNLRTRATSGSAAVTGFAMGCGYALGMRTLQALRQRLKPSARLIVAPNSGSVERGLARSVAFASESIAFAVASGSAATTMAERLTISCVEEDQAMLHDAGFTDVATFAAAFSFRGWVATAKGPSPKRRGREGGLQRPRAVS